MSLEQYDLTIPAVNEFSAALIQRSERQSKALHKLALERQPDLVDVPSDEIYTFSAEISNGLLDSYFTKMGKSSLKNYATGADEGVAFMNSHRHGELPMGYSMAGEFEEGDPNDNSTGRVIADFYTIKNLNVNGLNTNDFIQSVKAGIVRDVSIGFSGGDFLCSICAQDIWSWDCAHIPGVKYEVVDDPGIDPEMQEKRDELCFAWIEDANLSEVSAVFDGATPNAMILKATRELRAGRLKPNTKQFLESKYRIDFKEPVVIPVREKGVENMSEKGGSGTSGAPEVFVDVLTELRATSREYGLKTVRVSNEAEALAAIGDIRTEIDRLKPFEKQAEEGRKLRALLVADACKEGIRALGDSFDKDSQTATMAELSIDAVSMLRDNWKAIADKNFAGKRRTSADEAS